MAYEPPQDLIEIQRRFFAAEERAAEAEDDDFTEAVREQQELALAKQRHIYWTTVPFADRYKVDMALREAARAGVNAGE